MAEDDVAKAKAAAKRIKAERASSSGAAAGKGKARSSQPVGTGGLTGLDAAMAELDMDNYDDDDRSDEDANGASANPLSLPAGVFSAGTQYYSSNKEDPYLKFGKGPKEGSKIKGKGKGKVAAAPNDDDSDFASSSEDDDEETDEDDLDDWQLRPGSDLLLLAARNEDDVSHLEVWVCEPPGTTARGEGGEGGASTEANVYVHHDVLLAAFPLCLAWMDAAPGSLLSSSSSAGGGRRGGGGAGDPRSPGSFVAVGTMEPGVEIWDVDEADAVEPVAVLGPAPFAAEARAAAAEAARIAEAAEDSEDGDGRKSTNNKKKSKKKSGKGGKKGPAAPATPTPPLPPPSSLPRRRSRKDAAAGGGHADAVLGLAWNGAFRNVLASASADRTVKIWDLASVGGGGVGIGIGIDGSGSASGPLSSTSPVATFCHHSGKVQAVAFNPADPPVLLTGGFDGTAALVDVRSPAGTGSRSSSSSSSPPSSVPSWKVGADVEALAWDPSNPTDFYVAAEDGVVSCFDARGAGAGAKPKFRLSAHSKAATALAFAGAGAGSAAAAGGGGGGGAAAPGCVAPGLLATGSTDKKVKLWDVSGGAPELVSTADLKVGAVFGLGFGGLDLPSPGGRPPRPLLAAAGAKGTVAVWDVAADEAVARRWRKTLG